MKFKKIILFIILLLSWFVLTAIYVYGSSNITVNTQSLGRSALTKATFDEFLKGQIIEGEFKAKENYMGQISVRFYNYNRINSDEVAFRLKEAKGKEWIYQNVYKTDQFQPNELFPFGFPTILESKNRLYVFEVESIKGKPDDSVTISNTKPPVMITYQYPKKLLLTNPIILADFIRGKIINTEYNFNLIFSFATYLVTLSILIFLEYLMLTKINRNLIKTYNKSVLIFGIGIVVLLLSTILYNLNLLSISESVSIIAYFVLVLGIVMRLYEHKLKDL